MDKYGPNRKEIIPMEAWIKSILFIQIVCFTSAQQTSINLECKANRPGQCYTLYKSTAGPLTWTQAQQQCITYNETLATVPDLDTQQTLEKLMPSGSNTGAWLAGQVDKTSVSWQSLKREIYQNISIHSPDRSNCIYLRVDVITEIMTAPCTDFKNSLCSYLSGSCTENEIDLGSLCLRYFEGADAWYSAVMTCKQMGRAESSLMRYEPSLLKLNTSDLPKGNFWLDVQRYTWEWKTGTVQSVAVEYYNWDKQTGNNIPGYCMYISSNGGKWRSQLCNSTTDVSYFVCEKDTTSPTDTTTVTDVDGGDMRKDGTATRIAPVKTSNKGISSKYIILMSVVACLVFVLVIVVIAVWCAVKKKSASGSQQSTSSAPSAPGTLTTVGQTESRCNIYEDQDDAGRGTRKKGVQYVYYNNASCEATVVTANGRHAARGGKTNGKTSSKRRTSGSDDSTDSPVAPSGGPLSWNDLCDLYAKEENDKNERTMRRASSNRAEVDCEQPDAPVYAKVNKERKRK